MEQEMSDMKTRFFTEIGHKLRTPLTLIGGPVTEVLNTSRLEEKARHHLEMVQRNSQWMLDLVNKMLDYSKTHNLYISDENAKVFANDEESINELNDEISEENDKRIRLLIVEDNDDLRYFLTSILDNEYTIIQAEDGQKGLEMAEREMPDFIISDVMMPVMDGLTMVHQIKQNKDICHIPIIILSAKASLDDRLQGLKEGIDDYITKPFSATYLKQRVRNIIDQRRMLQQTYIEQIVPEDSSTFKLEAPQIVDADKEMMKKLLDYMNENISNANIRIEDLADAVNLGRTVFYGKIKSITGMTPIDFVHHIRIERAEELIANSNYQISQISYLTGFSDPKYFSHSFKKDTGMTPSEYRNKAK
jgi:YesN/AraC family two-component response regulator